MGAVFACGPLLDELLLLEKRKAIAGFDCGVACEFAEQTIEDGGALRRSLIEDIDKLFE